MQPKTTSGQGEKTLLSQAVETLPKPVKVERLALHLKGCDSYLYQEIVLGFIQGFQLHSEGPQIGQISQNLHSAAQHLDIVDTELTTELLEGHILCPLEQPPFDNFLVSPLGFAPKKGQVNTE